MIKITVTRNDDHSISSFRVTGHAGYAASGQDIVCAGVSAVTVGTVNAVEALLSVELPAEMKDGWLSARIPANLPGDVQQQVQLLLESMMVMLESIQDSYGSYIQIRTQSSKKEVDRTC
jgi:uncharacterized protein